MDIDDILNESDDSSTPEEDSDQSLPKNKLSPQRNVDIMEEAKTENIEHLNDFAGQADFPAAPNSVDNNPDSGSLRDIISKSGVDNIENSHEVASFE